MNGARVHLRWMLLAALLTGGLQTGVLAQSEFLSLWPGATPGGSQPGPEALPDRGDSVLRLTSVKDPFLLVYAPDSARHNGKALVICPGGGYEYLAVDKEGAEVALWLNELGYTAFVLIYRVPGQPDAALNDLHRAIRLVRSLSGRWRIDPARVGVLGFSAGAHLSARAATQAARPKYANVDEADLLSARPDYAMLIYPGLMESGGKLSAQLTPGPGTPPMFLFGTADDPHGQSTLLLAGALRSAGTSLELHLLPSGGHGYGLRPGNVAANLWPGMAATWLEGQTQCRKSSVH
ncbi:MAG: alpha/beta hydrolase [Bacteroidales bacterium]